MSVVNGKDVVLSIGVGGTYYPVACNAVCSLNFERDAIETTFRDSSDIRQFIGGKAIITLEGSGPIEYAAGYTPADVFDAAYSNSPVNWQFEISDTKGHAGITRTYNGSGFFKAVNLTGDVQQAATCDYTIQVSGDISGTTDPGTTPPMLRTRFYTATGGEVTLFNALWLDADMIEIARNGIALEIISSGTLDGNKALFDPIAGTITFDAAVPLSVDEYIQTIFES